MRLSRTERWILSNQLEILATLKPKEAEYYLRTKKAIDSGFEIEYAPEHIDENSLTEEECMEVLDILTMFESLEASYAALKDKDGIEKFEVTFSGWDGNNESKQLSYAAYFCKGQDRFEALGNRAYANSHAPLLQNFRVKLAKWKELDVYDRNLTKEELLEVVESWRNEKKRLDEAYNRSKGQ